MQVILIHDGYAKDYLIGIMPTHYSLKLNIVFYIQEAKVDVCNKRSIIISSSTNY